MISKTLAPVVLVALAGCTTIPEAGEAAAGEVAAIRFTTSPCFGFCPDFTVQVPQEGLAGYEGRRFVAVKGFHDFAVSQAEFAAFRKRLEPFRPEQSVRYDYEHCDGPVATDSPSVAVTWTMVGGEEVTLDWYMGCRQPGLSENAEEISGAWRELPLDDLVGTEQNRTVYEDF